MMAGRRDCDAHEEIGFRVDGGARIGAGHVMRCLALAQAFERRGHRVSFVSRCETESLCQRIYASGAAFLEVEETHPHPDDLRATLAYVETSQPRILVIDGYHFDPMYQRTVRDAGVDVLLIDDVAHWPTYHVKYLLNQNIYGSKLTYRCDSDTVLFLGPRYVLLRAEFDPWRAWRREIAGCARRVLVTLGGSDEDNVTCRVIHALSAMRGLEVLVVVGPSNPHAARVDSMPSHLVPWMRVLRNVTDMAALMAWADVAVVAGGTTSWELAFMGLPAVMVVLAENQRYIAEGLDAEGVVVNLGWHVDLSEHRMAEALAALIEDAARREEMSSRGRALVDGRGAERVVAAVLESDG